MERRDLGRRLAPCCAALLLSALAPGQIIQRPTLVVDLNTAPSDWPGSSNAALLAEGGGVGWFEARDEHGFRSIWSTDGSWPNTRLTFTRPAHEQDPIRAARTLADGRLVYETNDGPERRRFYALGRDEDHPTALLETTSPRDAAPSTFVEWHGELWFATVDEGQAVQLWRTDGTPGGTGHAEHVRVLGSRLDPPRLEIHGNRLWLIPPGVGNHRVASKDAPNRSTRLFVDPTGQAVPLHEIWADLAAGVIHLTEDSYGRNRELWIGDEFAGVQRRVLPNHFAANASTSHHITTRGDDVWFAWYSSQFGSELWITNGTPASTRLVADIHPGNGSSLWDIRPSRHAFLGDRLVFVADDGTRGREPWVSDGTAAGTRPLAEIVPGWGSSELMGFVAGRDRVWFTTGSSPWRNDLWSTDGTARGTRLELDRLLGFEETGFETLFAIDDRLVFRGYESTFGGEPWSITAGTGNPLLLANIHVQGNTGSHPETMASQRDHTLATASIDGDLHPLIRTDGTAAGTRPILSPPPRHETIRTLADLPVGQVFTVTTGPVGSEVWVTDGTASGTRHVATASGYMSWWSGLMELVLDHEVWFSISVRGTRRWWATDGTAAGSRELSALNPMPWFDLLGTDGRHAFGSHGSPTHGGEPWVTDGTAAGTRMLVDTAPGTASSAVFGFDRFHDEVLFLSVNENLGSRIWISDGTTAGTRMVIDFPHSYLPPDRFPMFVAADSQAFFLFDDGTHGTELWRTDGTRSGTRLVADLDPGAGHSWLHSMVAVRDRLFFLRSRNGSAFELWVSDGTPSGTAAVYGSSGAQPFVVSQDDPPLALGGDFLLFVAKSPEHGRELWISDGTAAGTGLLVDVCRGPCDSWPMGVRQVGDRLVFTADDGRTGRELHSIRLSELGRWIARRIGGYCGATLLVAGGAAIPGRSLQLQVKSRPGQWAALFVDTHTRRGDPTPGCELLLSAPSLLAVDTADGSGVTRIHAALPAMPALLGTRLYFQAAVLRSGGPFLGSADLSNGIEAFVGR